MEADSSWYIFAAVKVANHSPPRRYCKISNVSGPETTSFTPTNTSYLPMAPNSCASKFSNTTERWLALQQRDPAANSAFFYGVDSTRIFCRPNCPGRLARRANIAFFDNIHAAQDAGYRPCQRCEPCNDQWRVDHQSRITFQRASALIAKAVQEGTQWQIRSIAAEVSTSSGHLHRLFKRFANTTPRLFAEAICPSAPDSRSFEPEVLCGTPTSSLIAIPVDDNWDIEPALHSLGAPWLESSIYTDGDSENAELMPPSAFWDVGMDISLVGGIYTQHSVASDNSEIREEHRDPDTNHENAIEESYVFWDMDWSQDTGPCSSGIWV